MKKLLILILSLIMSAVMFGCGGGSSDEDTKGGNITVLYYSIGDDLNHTSYDLSNDIIEDIELYSKYINNKVNVVCEFKLNSSKNVYRGPVDEFGGNYANYPVLSNKLDMGNGETLENFIVYAKKIRPADHYILLLGGHGNGYYVEETKACLWTNNDTYLSNGTVGEVCKPYNLDCIIYATCNMACFENITCIKDSFDYVMASEHSISNINTKDFITCLTSTNNFLEGLTLFAKKQGIIYKDENCDWHLIDCSKIDCVLKSVKAISDFLIKNHTKYNDKVNEAFKLTVPINGSLCDFENFTSLTNEKINNNNFNNLLNDYKKSLNDAQIVNSIIKGSANYAPGLGFSLCIPSKENYNKYYKDNYPQTDFAKATGWDYFLKKYKLTK